MPISRREMVAGIATTLTTTPAGAKTDTELVALGKQFDALTRVLDAADLWGDIGRRGDWRQHARVRRVVEPVRQTQR
jgi:hypothetical protein